MNKEISLLSREAIQEKWEKGAIVVVDTRDSQVFEQGFIPGSISLGLNGRFAESAVSILPAEQDIVLVCEEGKEEASFSGLARVGFANILGCLKGGFGEWKNAGNPFDLIINVEPDELALDLPYEAHLLLVDVREKAEFDNGHVEGAINIPLGALKDPASMALFEDHHNIYLYCANGYRSTIAASLLKRQGIHNLRNIGAGWQGLQTQTGIPVEKETSMLN